MLLRNTIWNHMFTTFATLLESWKLLLMRPPTGSMSLRKPQKKSTKIERQSLRHLPSMCASIFFLSISCFYSPYLYIDGPFLQAVHLTVFLVALVVNLVGFPDASDDSCSR